MSNDKTIYKMLTDAGLTPAGAAGLMGNLYAESGLIPDRVELLCLKRLREQGKIYTDATYTAFVDDGTISRSEFLHPLPGKQYGYGLAQWTSPGRKGRLYDYIKERKVSIGDLAAQVSFLLAELKTDYQALYALLCSTGSVREASDAVLKKYEMPADTGTAIREQRYQYSLKYYPGETAPIKAVTAQDALGVMRSWLGLNEYDLSHKPIIDLYNSYRPLARGYKVTYSDSWCDATVSAVFIKLGAVSLIGGTECGVMEHVRLFRAAGIWLGRIRPQVGDIIVYDWQGDGYADHIGMVEQVSGDSITTIEGNYSDSVKRRSLRYDRSDIMGYARPKYTTAPAPTPAPAPKQDDVRTTVTADKFDAKLAGTYTATTGLNLRYGPGSKKYEIMCTMPKGHKVQCYGYYSLNGTAKWLYVQTTLNGVKYTGFCSKGYLKK